jgi:hypothetical protein
MVDRFWFPPVPLPARPATLATDVDLLLRQLPTPGAEIGGAELVARLRERYAAFAPGPPEPVESHSSITKRSRGPASPDRSGS